MLITKEQLDQDIAQTKANLETIKASVHQLTGALIVLESMRKYLDLPTPEPEASTHISEENRAIQERDNVRIMSMDAEEESLDYANR